VARSSFVFHFVNGFERDDGTIVIDAIRTDRFPAMPGSAELLSGGAFYPAPLLTRYELDPRSGKVQETCASRIPCELPTSSRAEATQDHGLVFAIAGDPLDENTTHVAPFFSKVARFDRHAGTERVKDLGSVLPGEPLFVPVESAPGGGYVLTLGFEGEREKSALFVLRADDLDTVAVCELPHGVPPGFHGTWVPGRAAS
jgi:carotenoid cleavage dioxygenase